MVLFEVEGSCFSEACKIGFFSFRNLLFIKPLCSSCVLAFLFLSSALADYPSTNPLPEGGRHRTGKDAQSGRVHHRGPGMIECGAAGGSE